MVTHERMGNVLFYLKQVLAEAESNNWKKISLICIATEIVIRHPLVHCLTLVTSWQGTAPGQGDWR